MFKRFLIITMALLSITTIRAQPPMKAVILYHQGVSFMNKEKYPEAMASFFKALATYKNYDSAYFQMANINVKFSSFDTAISFYNKALKINPKFFLAYMNLANIYRNFKEDIDKTLTYYLKAREIDSTNKEALIGAAWCYNVQLKYDLAITTAKKALQFDNNYKPAYGELAHAYHLSGRYAEAIEQFKKNIAISPTETPMYYCGLCYIELKDKAGALSMYDALVKLSPKMADALKARIDKM